MPSKRAGSTQRKAARPRSTIAARRVSDSGDVTPIYRWVGRLIAAQIQSGAYAADDQLPSERDLSEAYGISRMTARNVYVALQSDGLVYRHNRRGWFVAPPKLHYALMRSVSFLSNVQAEGGMPLAEVIRAGHMDCPAWLMKRLGAGAREKIITIRRRLSIGTRPAMVEEMFMPEARFPGLLQAELDKSISAIWEQQYDVHIKRSVATISGRQLSAEDADILGVEVGFPGIHLDHTMYDQHGMVVAVDIQHWRSDIAEFSIDVDFGRLDVT